MNVLCGRGQRSVELWDQRYGYKMLMYLLCAAPTELWARPARLDISYPLALWRPKKKSELAPERRAFKVNKPEKWQTLHNEELPENTHSVAELTWRTNPAWKRWDPKIWKNVRVGQWGSLLDLQFIFNKTLWIFCACRHLKPYAHYYKHLSPSVSAQSCQIHNLCILLN